MKKSYMIIILFLLFLNASAFSQQCGSNGWLYRPSSNATFPSQIIGLPTGWIQDPTISDDFTGTSLNASKWSKRDHFCHGMSPYAIFKRDNVDVNNGLKLWCIPEINAYCPGSSQEYDYSSGWVTSNPFFRYGYMEIKCKLPNEPRLHPCFWTDAIWNNNPTVYDEIDVWECQGLSNTLLSQNIAHNLNFPDQSQTAQMLQTNFDQWFTGRDITFGIEWLPYEINYYINGQVTACAKYTTDGSVISPGMYVPRSEFSCVQFDKAMPQKIELSLSLWYPTSNLSEPFEIYYIHAYKLQDGFNYTYWPLSINPTDAYLSKVHKDVILGGNGHNGEVPQGSNINIWAHNSVTLNSGFEVSAQTAFTARTVRSEPELFIQTGPLPELDNNK